MEFEIVLAMSGNTTDYIHSLYQLYTV